MAYASRVSPDTDPVSAAREALDRHHWDRAFELLQEADAAGGLDADGLELFFQASWWTGHPDDSIDVGERAFKALLDAGERERAAMMAYRVGEQHGIRMAAPVAGGWMGRAAALVEDLPDSVVRGYLTYMQGFAAIEFEGRYEEGLPLLERALEIAKRHGDQDLYGRALHDKGRALMWTGKVEEGSALMDEAMVIAVGGEMQPFEVGYVYCSMIAVCSHLGDLRRSSEWTQATVRWAEREAIPAFSGICRIHRAEILRHRGELEAAEVQARLAFEELPRYNFLFGLGQAWYEIGEVRRRLGDYPAAEEAFTKTHETGVFPETGLSLVRLGQGRLQAAAEGVRSALRDGPKDPLSRARYLAAQIQISLALDDVGTAAAALDDLEPLIEPFPRTSLRATAEAARGAVLLARGEPEEALGHLRASLRWWQGDEAPYEGAEVRILLAQAHRALGEDDAATMELRTARSVFGRIGARAAEAEADRLLGEIMSAAGTPERVNRAFMFTDIVGSTDLVGVIGDEAWEDLLAWHDQTLRALFARSGGEEAHHTGDGFFVTFPDARSAVACAVDVQRALVAHRREHGFSPGVRIGVHLAQATRRGSDYSGAEVHKAARIAAAAQGGEILASAEVLEETGREFAATEERELSLKGIPDPVRVASLSWRE